MPGSLKRKSCKFVFSMLLGIMVAAWMGCSVSNAVPYGSFDEIVRFADHLMKEKDYTRAFHEFSRCLNKKAPASRLLTIHEKILTCLAKLQDRPLVRRELLALSGNQKMLEITPADWLRFGQILEREKDYLDAAYAYNMCSKTTTDAEMFMQASLRETKMYFLTGNESKAKKLLAKIRESSRDMAEYQQVVSIMEAGEKPDKKKPGRAMLMSAVLPGSGHVYAGAPFHGLSSFLLNAGLISAAYFSFRNNSPILGSFIGYLETGLYVGGIKSAGEDARRANTMERRIFIKKLKKILPVEPVFNMNKNFRSVEVVYRF